MDKIVYNSEYIIFAYPKKKNSHIIDAIHWPNVKIYDFGYAFFYDIKNFENCDKNGIFRFFQITVFV